MICGDQHQREVIVRLPEIGVEAQGGFEGRDCARILFALREPGTESRMSGCGGLGLHCHHQIGRSLTRRSRQSQEKQENPNSSGLHGGNGFSVAPSGPAWKQLELLPCRPSDLTYYQITFAPNCSARGLLAMLVILPKLAVSAISLFG